MYGVMCVLGGVLLWGFARAASTERMLRRLLLISYIVRTFFSLLLFAASYWQWPVLRPLQTAPGFWAFGLDSIIYDYYGDRMVQAWALGVELPNSGLGIEYFLVVALVYKFFGVHPLNVIVFNCWLASLTALLAYRLAGRLFSTRVAWASALLVGFWPSSLIWSAQLLKDSLCWLLIFAALLLVVTECSDVLGPSRPLSVWRIVRWLTLGVVVILMTRLRFYLGLSLSVATLTVCVPAACVAWLRHRRVRDGLGCLGLSMFVVIVMLFARTVDLFALVSPRHPEWGHLRLAERYWRHHDPETAAAEYLRALELNDRYKEAYLGFATMMMELGRFPEAVTAYQDYLAQDQDVERRLLISRIIATIHQRLSQPSLPQAEPPAPVLAALPEPPGEGEQTQQPSLPVEPPRQARGSTDGVLRLASLAHLGAEHLGARQDDPSTRRGRHPERGAPGKLVPSEVEGDRGPSRGVERGVISAGGGDDLLNLAYQAFQKTSEPLDASSSDPPRDSLSQLQHGVSQVDDQAVASVQQMTPESLGVFRQGFVHAGGYSLMDAWSQISSLGKLLSYLPRALAIGFLAPFPWQWFDVKGSTGFMRALAGIEVMLVYWLFPAILVGSAAVLRQRRPESLLLLMFVICLAVPMSLVVANLGTLFRLRLQFLLPLLILGAAGDPVATSRSVTQWVVRGWRGRLKRRSGANGPDGVPTDEPLLTAMSETRS